MTVLVTGAGGFVGNHIFKSFNVKGEKFTIERDVGKRDLSSGIAVRGDLKDADMVTRAVVEYRPDIVIHVAASAIVNQGLLNPTEMYTSNVIGTLNLLEACKKLANKDLYFLYFGTDKVLGDSRGAKEEDPYPWERMGPYEQSKAMAEVLTKRYAGLFKVARTRSANIYGPGDVADRIIPNGIRRMLAGMNPQAYNTDKRQYIYVDDVVDAIHFLVAKRLEGTWHLGTPVVMTSDEVCKEMVEAFDDSSLSVEMATDQVAASQKYLYYIHEQWLDYGKLRGKGWNPTTMFPEGIRKTIDWWKRR